MSGSKLRALDQYTLGELLVVPYIRTAYSAQRGDTWTRTFEYVELTGCRVESVATLDALRALEKLRVSHLLLGAYRGELGTPPRAPLAVGSVRNALLALDVDVPQRVLDLSAVGARGAPELRDVADSLATVAQFVEGVEPWPWDRSNHGLEGLRDLQATGRSEENR